MLWPLVLPAQITAAILTACVAAATALAPLARLRRWRAFLASAFLALAAFIPSCCVVMRAVDARRFGAFEYDAFARVMDPRVERYLPPAATNITLDKRPGGFRARYRIAEADLRAYVDAAWRRSGADPATRPPPGPPSDATGPYLELLFGDLGWPPPPASLYFPGPAAPNGAGFAVWYSPTEKTAYERAGYW